MKVYSQKAVQVHAVPEHVTYPVGPFPPEMLKESEIIYDYPQAGAEDGSDFLPGSTVQNNFKPPRHLRCGVCNARVLETETKNHICEQ